MNSVSLLANHDATPAPGLGGLNDQGSNDRGILLEAVQPSNFRFVIPYRPCGLIQRGNFPVYWVRPSMREALDFILEKNPNKFQFFRLRWVHFEFGDDPDEKLGNGIVIDGETI